MYLHNDSFRDLGAMADTLREGYRETGIISEDDILLFVKELAQTMAGIAIERGNATDQQILDEYNSMRTQHIEAMLYAYGLPFHIIHGYLNNNRSLHFKAQYQLAVLHWIDNG